MTTFFPKLESSRGTDVLIFTFIVLKVAGYIDWPWLWVLTPLWVSLAYIGVLVLVHVATVLYLRWRNPYAY